jgi:hypothetical protein
VFFLKVVSLKVRYGLVLLQTKDVADAASVGSVIARTLAATATNSVCHDATLCSKRQKAPDPLISVGICVRGAGAVRSFVEMQAPAGVGCVSQSSLVG